MRTALPIMLTIIYRLDDPFIGFNEIKAEWVGEAAWTYKLDFDAPEVPAGCTVTLAFDGLDTFANVKLDGLTILQSDNMFLPHRVDVTKAMSRSNKHTLEIDFESAFLKGGEIKESHPEHKWLGFNGDMGRLAVRKAQYHWGWDWGPVLNCAGIWRPVRLEIYHLRVADIRTDVELASDYASAVVNITTDVEHHGNHSLKAIVWMTHEEHIVASTTVDVASEGSTKATLKIEKPFLWMPNGYGNQTLYDVCVSLFSDKTMVHEVTKRIGLRRIELVQEPDKHGKSFYFRVNGVDIFCGGSCWIPADSFLTNITLDRYRAWIALMVPANQKMIRSAFVLAAFRFLLTSVQSMGWRYLRGRRILRCLR